MQGALGALAPGRGLPAEMLRSLNQMRLYPKLLPSSADSDGRSQAWFRPPSVSTYTFNCVDARPQPQFGNFGANPRRLLTAGRLVWQQPIHVQFTGDGAGGRGA